MKHSQIYLLGVTALALSHWGTAAMASEIPAASGMQEVSDAELGTMRGRYTVGDNNVAWFGVRMISTWQSSTGQVVQGTLALAMDFSQKGAQPKITFQPTVSITRADAPLPLPVTGNPVRNVNAAGLANVGGVVQSVQVAGDGNQASNITRLTIHDGSTAPPSVSNPLDNGTSNDTLTASSQGASATASFDGHSADVLLTIVGQGAVTQWIRNGSLGQSIQLTADNQWVSNSIEIDLIRQSISSNTQLAQNVAQAINLARGVGLYY